MSDAINAAHVIEADEVNPDEILFAVQKVLNEVEDSLDRRAAEFLPIAVNWNQARIELEPALNGDLKIALRVPVL